jgi:hypothetical protein
MSLEPLCLCQAQPSGTGIRCSACDGRIPSDDVLGSEVANLGMAGPSALMSGEVDVVRQVLDRVPDARHWRTEAVSRLGHGLRSVAPIVSVTDLGSSREEMRSVRIEVTWDGASIRDVDILSVIVPEGYGSVRVAGYHLGSVRRDAGRNVRPITVQIVQPTVGDYELVLRACSMLGVGTDGFFEAWIPLKRAAAAASKTINVASDGIYSNLALGVSSGGSANRRAESHAFRLLDVRATSPAAWSLHIDGCVRALIVAADRLALGRGDSVQLGDGEAFVPVSEIAELDAHDASISRRAVELTFTASRVKPGRGVVRIAQRIDDAIFDALLQSRPDALPMVDGEPRRHDARIPLHPSRPVRIDVGHDGGPDGDQQIRGRASLSIELESQFGAEALAVCIAGGASIARPKLVWLPTVFKAGWRLYAGGVEGNAVSPNSVLFRRDPLRRGLGVCANLVHDHEAVPGQSLSFQVGEQLWKLLPVDSRSHG